MPSITVKNIPDEMYARIKQSAKVNRRSVNNEIIYQLEQKLFSNRVNEEEVLFKARAFRSKVKGSLSPEEIENAINEGRE